jgi:uncharacterized protein
MINFMPRPNKCRKVFSTPNTICFKPAGIPISNLEEIILTLDEFEAIRLADFEGLYQEQAALEMNISRQTFGNIINSAHTKIADFLISGKYLQITGGTIEIGDDNLLIVCRTCKHRFNSQIAKQCPRCNPKKREQ